MKFDGYLESHTHSAYSDGVFADKSFIKKIYEIRSENNLPLKKFAITDHDSMNALEPLDRNNRAFIDEMNISDPLEIVPGTEFTTTYLGVEAHILGYFPACEPDSFNRYLKPAAEKIINWNEERMLKADVYKDILGNQFTILGIEFNFDSELAEESARKYYRQAQDNLAVSKSGDLLNWKANVSRGCMRRAVDEQLGIPDIALQIFTIRAHSSANHAEALREFFTANCRKNHDLIDSIVQESIGKILYDRKETLSPVSAEEAVAAITDSGGAAVFAHPGETVLSGITGFASIEHRLASVNALKDHGLKGVEVFYPSHSEELTKRLIEFCREEDFTICGGSDWHGKSEAQHSRLGRYTPEDSLTKLFSII